ncbi:MAG: capsular biosynthesis protein [Pikeienuella sp.]
MSPRDTTPPGAGRHLVLLQGPASWFFWHLGAALEASGAAVTRVLLSGGDRLFWRGPAVSFRGRPAAWRPWLRRLLAERGATDLVCLGDGRDWHCDGIAEAQAAGARVHIVEQGYLRPGWITVEPDGMGARSRIPRDPARIRALADDSPASGGSGARPGCFANYAAMDVAWNLATLLARPAWPHYRVHALHGPVFDWAGWLGKAVGAPLAARRAHRVLSCILQAGGPVFIFPLQLETDFQIRRDGPPGGVAGALETVIASFARAAPPRARLVVKRHPLDNGLALWARRVRRAAAAAGVGARCHYLAGGDLDWLLGRAAGLVTVNSTAGLTALRCGIPVKLLGHAIYDVPGLTDRQALDGFWRAPTPPDHALTEAFVTMLAHTVQVPGGFDGPSVRAGAAGTAARILGPVPF